MKSSRAFFQCYAVASNELNVAESYCLKFKRTDLVHGYKWIQYLHKLFLNSRQSIGRDIIYCFLFVDYINWEYEIQFQKQIRFWK